VSGSPPGGDCLLQRSIDRREVGVQRGAEGVDRRDNGERDPCRDQTVFDRRRTRFILPELQKSIAQSRLRFRQSECAPALRSTSASTRESTGDALK
jgi:hypothetical protein